ncbi:MAG TPA: hypothetical protein VNH44_08695 [Micropepsaceae bacterium]|nr:hypothetical protein [Micropepsaceae bacterium]
MIALLMGAALSSPTKAQPYRARQGVQSGQVRSLDEILNGIRRERPGSLADVQGPDAGPQGEPHYRLKWLTPDGRVLFLDTDARTGRVLGVEGDDRRAPPAARGRPAAPRPQEFYPDGPPVGPPNGYQRGIPGGIERGLPPGYNQGPPGYGRGSPGRGSDRGPQGPRGGFGRFRNGR